MRPHLRSFRVAVAIAALSAAGCSLDLGPNPNSPDAIGENPSRAEVGNTARGMLIAMRIDYADFPLDMGIIGREVIRIDGSDPRFTGELLQGPLDPGSDAFGGDHWADQYTAIRGGNNLLAVIGTATALTAAEQSAVQGFVRTIQALNFLMILNSHTQDSIAIDVGIDVTAEPAPFVARTAAFAHIVTLLDEAKTNLLAGGAAFPFSLPPGFAGFDTPTTFLRFNRGLRARVAVYQNDFAAALTALGESFIDPAGSMNAGVNMDYGTGPGDFANPLSIDPQTGENFAHPSLATGAQLQPGGARDRRFLDKIVTRPSGATPDGLTSNLGWIRYPSPSSPIPIIRNEELLLLRAEANIGLNQLGPALTDINTVRTVSGGLAALGGFASQAAALDELLYNKLYSLVYEGAHRWIDARHYGRLAALPRDRAADIVFSTLPIPTDETLARQ